MKTQGFFESIIELVKSYFLKLQVIGNMMDSENENYIIYERESHQRAVFIAINVININNDIYEFCRIQSISWFLVFAIIKHMSCLRNQIKFYWKNQKRVSSRVLWNTSNWLYASTIFWVFSQSNSKVSQEVADWNIRVINSILQESIHIVYIIVVIYNTVRFSGFISWYICSLFSIVMRLPTSSIWSLTWKDSSLTLPGFVVYWVIICDNEYVKRWSVFIQKIFQRDMKVVYILILFALLSFKTALERQEKHPFIPLSGMACSIQICSSCLIVLLDNMKNCCCWFCFR